jgi:predicted Zn-dependent protease
MGLRLTPEARARDAATKFVTESKVQVAASGDTSINGLPATVIVGQAQVEQGVVGVWNAFIELEGRVYSLLGYTPAQVFEQLRPTFESVASGFSPLRDPSVMNVQPARLRLVRAERGGAFASFVPTSLPPELTAEEVAIMNQVQLNEAVPPGRILKVPDTTGAVPAAWASQPAPASVPTPYPPPSGYPQNYPPPAYPSQPAATQPAYPSPQNRPPVWPR